MNFRFLEIFQFLSVVLFLTAVQAESNPGLKLRPTNNGIEYMSNIGRQMLGEQLAAFRIDDFTVPFTAGPGRGEATAKNMRIVNYQPPTFFHQLKAPDTFQWRTSNGLIKVQGEWSAYYKMVAKITGSGWFDVQAKDTVDIQK